MKKHHIGSNFDDFLQEGHLLDVAKATAIKRVIAFQIAQRDEAQQADPVGGGHQHEDESGSAGTEC